MCCKTPPFGHLGYPKGRFGVWETGFPGIGTRVQRWSFGVSRAEKWGSEASLHAQNWVKGEKEQSFFAIFRACKTASLVDIKHVKITPKPPFLTLYIMLISNILHYILLHINNNFPATTEALCNGLRICICNCKCKRRAFVTLWWPKRGVKYNIYIYIILLN